MFGRRLLILIVAIAFIGGVFGLIISTERADANPPILRVGILDYFLNLFKRPVPEAPLVAQEQQPVELYKPVLGYEEAVIKAVERTEPSVVSIVVTKDLPVMERCPYNPFGDLPPEFRRFFDDDFGFSRPCQRGTERTEIGGGTGFIVSADGLIVTNKHVVFDKEADYTVLTNDGEKYNAKVLARDPVQDLAVIKIDPPAGGLPAATLGDSDSIKLGQTAIAIGNSLGEFRNTVSVGVISGLSRTIIASGQGIGVEILQGVIQTDAAINPGNSGGPLLNLRGEVIGINTAIASGAQNIGFAIPINQAKRDIESVKRTGDIKVSYVGVRYFTVTPEFAEAQELPVDYGALVRGGDDGPGVLPDSPASRAGLQEEDIILEINGEKLTRDNPLGLVIQKYNIGDTITLKVRRGEETIALQVVLGERPEL